MSGGARSGRAAGAIKEQTRKMGSFTIWHWLVVLVVVALVFGLVYIRFQRRLVTS